MLGFRVSCFTTFCGTSYLKRASCFKRNRYEIQVYAFFSLVTSKRRMSTRHWPSWNKAGHSRFVESGITSYAGTAADLHGKMPGGLTLSNLRFDAIPLNGLTQAIKNNLG